MKKLMVLISVVMAFGLLTGCMEKESTVKKNTTAVAEELLKEKPQKTNTNLKNSKVYFPEGIVLSDDQKTNVVLEGIGGTYVLFQNPKEGQTSEMNYNLLKDQKGDKEVFVDITKNSESDFEYVLVLKNSEKKYEVSAGVGGHKISAVVKKSKLEKTVREIVPIVKSIVVKE